MNVCIIGNGLASLSLAKALLNEGVSVDMFFDKKSHEINKSRTIGISRSNVNFFNEKILDISNFLWPLKKIEIFSENLDNKKILNFQNNKKQLFSIIKNYDLYNFLYKSLIKNKLFKLKNLKDLDIDNYKLVINCDQKNFLTKKYFQKKMIKKYNSFAYTTIIEHKKSLNNNTAVQIFTKRGPLAFLPISNNKTSVVYSIKGLKEVDLKSLIRKYNFKYSIKKINEVFNFELKSSALRNYYSKNILAFGDLLHKIHPLAGQGFNMTIRDTKLLMDLIKFRINHGLDIDKSICIDFEKNIKHKNYLFSTGIDFVYEFFNFETKLNNSFLSRSIKLLGTNEYANKMFRKIADDGITI